MKTIQNIKITINESEILVNYIKNQIIEGISDGLLAVDRLISLKRSFLNPF